MEHSRWSPCDESFFSHGQGSRPGGSLQHTGDGQNNKKEPHKICLSSALPEASTTVPAPTTCDVPNLTEAIRNLKASAFPS